MLLYGTDGSQGLRARRFHRLMVVLCCLTTNLVSTSVITTYYNYVWGYTFLWAIHGDLCVITLSAKIKKDMLYIYIYTIRLFNIAMENRHF
jgi:hypothetical protein